MRHAESLDGRARFIGRTDIPLSPAGEEQARSLSGTFQKSNLQRLYCSPLSRARSTVAPIAADTGLAPTVLEDLAEIALGEWEGRMIDSIRQEQPQAFAARGNDFAGFRPPGGESFLDLQIRARTALNTMLSGPLPALAVTHAGVLRVLACLLEDRPLSDLFHHRPQFIHSTVVSAGTGGPALLRQNASPSLAASLAAEIGRI